MSNNTEILNLNNHNINCDIYIKKIYFLLPEEKILLSITEKQKKIKNNLKKFYKDITNIEKYLDKFINATKEKIEKQKENKNNNESIYIKGSIRKDTKNKTKIKKYKEKFMNKWGSFESSNTDDIKTNYYYYNLKNKILYIKKTVLLAFTNKIIVESETETDIETKYENAVNEIKQLHTNKSKELEGKLINLNSKKNIVTKKTSKINIFINDIVTLLYKFNTKNKNENENIYESTYIKEIYKNNKINKSIKIMNTIEFNVEDTIKQKKEKAKILTKNYRKILKYLFMIMENYYFIKLKYKHTLTYKSLNNSYQKSKASTFSKFKRLGPRLKQSFYRVGEYKSPVRLDSKYRINPLFGLMKGRKTKGTGANIFGYEIAELKYYKEKLVEQIEKYNKLLNTDLGTNLNNKIDGNKTNEKNLQELVPKEGKHFEFYEVKKRLAKEIRKLKIIKFFLLRKTVRLKKRSFNKRPKLINTINTLKAKLEYKIPNILGIDEFKLFNQTDTTLNSKSNKINHHIKTLDDVKFTKFKKKKIMKTKKRLQKFKKMIEAKEIIKGINIIDNEYKKRSNFNSKLIKNKINNGILNSDKLMKKTKTNHDNTITTLLNKKKIEFDDLSNQCSNVTIELNKNINNCLMYYKNIILNIKQYKTILEKVENKSKQKKTIISLFKKKSNEDQKIEKLNKKLNDDKKFIEKLVIINPKDEDFKFNIVNFNDDTYSVDVNQDEIIFNIINNKNINNNTNNSNTSEKNINTKNVDVGEYWKSLENYITSNNDKFEKIWFKCSEINNNNKNKITVNYMNEKINSIKTDIQNFKIYKDNIFKINQKIINQFNLNNKDPKLPLPAGEKDNVTPSPSSSPSQVAVNSPLTNNVTPSPSPETLKNYLKEISL